MSIDSDRSAELTLLAILHGIPETEKLKKLYELGVTVDEYNYLLKKWAKVMDRYEQELDKLKCQEYYKRKEK